MDSRGGRDPLRPVAELLTCSTAGAFIGAAGCNGRLWQGENVRRESDRHNAVGAVAFRGREGPAKLFKNDYSMMGFCIYSNRSPHSLSFCHSFISQL